MSDTTVYEKQIAQKVFTQKSFEHMIQHENIETIHFGDGGWLFNYIKPSIYQVASYDLEAKVTFKSEQCLRSTKRVKNVFSALKSYQKIFKMLDFEHFMPFLDVYFDYFEMMARYKIIEEYPELKIRVLLDGEQVKETYFTLPYIELSDKVKHLVNMDHLVIKTKEIVYRNGYYYIMDDKDMRKISSKKFEHYLFMFYMKSLFSNCNRVLNINTCIENQSVEKIFELVETNKSLVEMVNT